MLLRISLCAVHKTMLSQPQTTLFWHTNFPIFILEWLRKTALMHQMRPHFMQPCHNKVPSNIFIIFNVTSTYFLHTDIICVHCLDWVSKLDVSNRVQLNRIFKMGDALKFYCFQICHLTTPKTLAKKVTNFS